jgi:hypothetical protein
LQNPTRGMTKHGKQRYLPPGMVRFPSAFEGSTPLID